MHTFVEELEARGLMFQKTPGIEEKLNGKTTLYVGFDPTGDCLHIGHLMWVFFLKRAYERGHNIIVLSGGGTAMIGDPGGRDAERPILPKEKIVENKLKIRNLLNRFFTFDDQRVRMVDNSDWLTNLTVIDFMRDAGKLISVNSMLDKDSVKNRIDRETGISYAEFSYQLLQSYDFAHLYETVGCEIQIGGSDQWGNIIQGVELIRKKLGKEAHALSFPLIVNPKTGKKFGKTAEGEAIWLDAEKTHPFLFYNFFINVDDELIPTLMNYYSFKPLEEIKERVAEWETDKGKRLLQKELAYEMTAIVHGKEVAEMCKKIANILFEKNESAMTKEDCAFIKKAVPNIDLKGDLVLEQALIDLNLVSSKSEARRLIEQKGVTKTELFGTFILIRKGKKDYGMVELVK